MNGQTAGRRHRKHVRLPGYDYSSPGYYFVTLLTLGRTLLFDDPRLRRAAEDGWRWLAKQYPHVELDCFVVMPNHLHGVIVVSGNAANGSSRAAATPNKPLGQLVGAFKTVSTKEINRIRGTPRAGVWQLNYYERVIRNDRELEAIRLYIVDNPAKWTSDPNNPGRSGTDRRSQGGSRAAATLR